MLRSDGKLTPASTPCEACGVNRGSWVWRYSVVTVLEDLLRNNELYLFFVTARLDTGVVLRGDGGFNICSGV
jgi:hypothetical protein